MKFRFSDCDRITSNGIFRSTNGGASWNSINGGLTIPSISSLAIDRSQWKNLVMDQSNPNTLYAGTVGSGVFETLDGGRTWGQVTLGLPMPCVTALAMSTSRTGTLNAGTLGGGILKRRF